jgi:predicted SnoaL-like aldol condensation-catalyzing enzyme
MAAPDRDSVATGLVSIGEEAIARINTALLDNYYADNYKLHSPAGDFNRDEIKAYFAALRESFTDFTISRVQILVESNFVSSRTVMAGRSTGSSRTRPSAPLSRTGNKCGGS